MSNERDFYILYVYILYLLILLSKIETSISLHLFRILTNLISSAISAHLTMDVFIRSTSKFGVFSTIKINFFLVSNNLTSVQRKHDKNFSVFVRRMCVTQRKIVSNYCFKQCSNKLFCFWCDLLLYRLIEIFHLKIWEFFPL